MEQWITHFMEQFGYWGIAFLIFLENIFPPIPSEIILTFGGFMTTHSNLSFIGVTLTSTDRRSCRRLYRTSDIRKYRYRRN